MEHKGSKINRQNINWLLQQPIDVQLETIKHHLEVVRIVINSILEQEVCDYAGEWYSHQKPHDHRYSRWGYNPGSIKLGVQKVRVDVPRIYDNNIKANKTLSYYEKLKGLPEQQEEIIQGVLHGLSTRDYEKVVEQLYDSFGLSSSTISRAFKERSTKILEEFEQRKFTEQKFVAIFIDGKYLAKQQMIIALGVNEQGQKIPLGVIQTTTENSISISELLRDLIARGLNYEDGILFIIDGAKGLHKAIMDVFGNKAVIQRCQWHKRENVVSYLPEMDQVRIRKKMQSAYSKESYNEAKSELLKIKQEIEVKNRSAAKSLEEGLEETLTIHRLGLYEHFYKSFTTTNCLESLNSGLSKYIGRVKYWTDSTQRYRWVVSGLVEIEKRMNKVSNYKKLHLMQKRIKKETEKIIEINKLKKSQNQIAA
ncbi:MAG: IS256 family transposase [Bacteroidetes bacterium]|nr:IS256 family transposase [Bacteroidota bacterium]